MTLEEWRKLTPQQQWDYVQVLESYVDVWDYLDITRTMEAKAAADTTPEEARP